MADVRDIAKALRLEVQEVETFYKALIEGVKAGKVTELDFKNSLRSFATDNRLKNDNACVGGSNACF